MIKKLSLMLCTLLASCASPQNYAGQEPEMDFYEFFSSPVDGWGTITDMQGVVTHRFHVLMDGKIQQTPSGDTYLQLDETFTYSDGTIKERYWKVYQTPEKGSLTAEAPEVPGGALGEQAGSAIQWKYKFDLPYKGKTIRVTMDDWMWMVDDKTLVNKNVIRKFGIKVGELNIFFSKK